MFIRTKGATIEIRAAEARDRVAVEGISAQIWSGDDYVPRMFDQWVADKEGEFSIIVVNGVVAGFGKLTMLTDRDAWLEGLRVGKIHRGLGLAKLITDYYVRISRERGFLSLRLSTFIENHASLHIIQTHGFRRIASFKRLTTKPQERLMNPPAVYVPQSLEEVKQALDQQLMSLRAGLLSFDFTFQSLSDDLLANLLNRRSVLALRRDDSIVGLLMLSSDHCMNNELSIVYQQADQEADLEALTEYALATAASAGQELTVMCPPNCKLLDTYKNQGFLSASEDDQLDVYVYEHESTLQDS